MKVIAFLKIFVCLSLISVSVTGQLDTTIYFAPDMSLTSSKSNAAYYSHVVTHEKDNFIMYDYAVNNSRWNVTEQTQIRKETNNSYTLVSNSQANRNKNITIKRCFITMDSGYIIKDYIDTTLIQEGISKLVFPLIRCGSWRVLNSKTGKIEEFGTYADNHPVKMNYLISEKPMEEPFVIVEKMPQYPEGDAVLLEDIEKNVFYPQEAKEKNITGTVLVRFIIMNDGSVQGARVLKNVHPLLDEAALKTVYSIPKNWNPGQQNGKKVNIYYMVPVYFKNSKN